MPAPPVQSAWDRPPGEHKPHRPSFGEEVPERPRRRLWSALLLALLCSLAVHLSVMAGIGIWNYTHQPPPAEPEQSVEMVDLSRDPALKAKLAQIEKIARIEEIKPAEPHRDDGKGQIVELPKPATPEQAPKDARFRAEDNHRVDQESVSRDQVMNPKVLSDEFKGMGDKGETGKSKIIGEQDKKDETNGRDEKTESKSMGKAEAVMQATPAPTAPHQLVDDFGIRTAPHVEDTPSPVAGPRGKGDDHDAETLRAGQGERLAMAGAPANDYLPDIPRGNKTALNAKADFFASFWIRVKRAVGPPWERNIHQIPLDPTTPKAEYITRLDVTLSANGAVTNVKVAQSCGRPLWDNAAVAAFNEVGVFPNPPEGLVDRDGTIHMDDLGFVISLTGGFIQHSYYDPRAGELFPGANRY